VVFIGKYLNTKNAPCQTSFLHGEEERVLIIVRSSLAMTVDRQAYSQQDRSFRESAHCASLLTKPQIVL